MNSLGGTSPLRESSSVSCEGKTLLAPSRGLRGLLLPPDVLGRIAAPRLLGDELLPKLPCEEPGLEVLPPARIDFIEIGGETGAPYVNRACFMLSSANFRCDCGGDKDGDSDILPLLDGEEGGRDGCVAMRSRSCATSDRSDSSWFCKCSTSCRLDALRRTASLRIMVC